MSRSVSPAHRTLYNAFEPRRSGADIEANVWDLRRDGTQRDAVLGAIEALRGAEDEPDAALNALRVVLEGGSREAI